MRRLFFLVSIPVLVFVALMGLIYPSMYAWLLVLGPLFLLGIYDCFQTKHAINKNFPVLGHLRYFFEAIRPEIQQYFVESNIDGRPISRNARSLVYQRAKEELETIPFGTQEDLYQEGREWVVHSMYPSKPSGDGVYFEVGSSQCSKKYRSSRFNISAMSYGSMSKHAISALNKGAKAGGFFHNTGEGGISPYHKLGGDLVWQIGTGYFGTRTPEGTFCEKSFAEKAAQDCVKMIELKLSQGAKPGKGGILPGVKVTEEIAKVRGVEVGKDVISPSSHKVFSTPEGLLDFIAKLRELSGGKPVGFKLCVGQKSEFIDLLEAIERKGILPDFISVDGGEGGTGAAPVEFSNSVGMPLKDGLSFVYQELKNRNLKNEITIIGSGKCLSGFDIIKTLALGADIVQSARGMMLSLGCIQALRCNSNHCPVGIATTNPGLMKGLHIQNKSKRVANYQSETLKALLSMLAAMGKDSPCDLVPADVYQRQSDGSYKTYQEIYFS